MVAVFPKILLSWWLSTFLCVAISSSVSVPRASAEEDQETTSEAPPADEESADAESPPTPDDAEEEASPVEKPDVANPVADDAKLAPKATVAKSKPSDAADAPGRPTKSPKPSKAKLTEEPVQAEEKDSSVDDEEETVLQKSKKLLGGIALVLEKQSQLLFRARVDTGAKWCSIHTEKLVIEDAAESMEDNIGKVVRVKLSNHEDESGWVETRIDRIVRVRTSERAERRYGVALVLTHDDFEKEVRVTLNDRSKMAYPLLLGRNFLHGDFIVDVDIAKPE